jgi:hypothetical protein
MSQPEQKNPRIGFICGEFPDRRSSVIVGSGLSANTSGIDNNLLVDSECGSVLLTAGYNPLALDATDEIYLEVLVDGELRTYNVAVVNGVSITFRVVFAAGENDDGFYCVTPLTETLINADWSMKIRGTTLTVPGSSPARLDRDVAATTVAGIASTYQNRRLYYVFPQEFGATVGSMDQRIDGYYMCAAITGMVASLPPQQGFTNYPITGFTAVYGSDDTFTESQLNEVAGGGVYIIIQETDGAPLICRHQLSTDVTTIEKRELSITKLVDFTQFMYYNALNPYIGRYNITQTLLDNLGTVAEGVSSFLTTSGVLIGARIVNIVQDETNRDTVLIQIVLTVPYPCNYVIVTLVV